MRRNNKKAAIVSAYVESAVRERGVVTVEEVIGRFSPSMCKATIYAGIKECLSSGSFVRRSCLLDNGAGSGGETP